MAEPFDFSDCLVQNTLMAARSVTRHFDDRLRPHGITATQFALMMTIRNTEGATVSDYARRIATDRTTLSRNLDLLESKGLTQGRPAERGNGRRCYLTPAGHALINDLIPRWQEGQRELRALLAGIDSGDFLTALKRLRAL